MKPLLDITPLSVFLILRRANSCLCADEVDKVLISDDNPDSTTGNKKTSKGRVFKEGRFHLWELKKECFVRIGLLQGGTT